MIKVLMAENAPSLNKGEMAIIGGILHSLSMFGKVNMTMLSDRADIDKTRYNGYVKILNIDRMFHISSDLRRKNIAYGVVSSLFCALQHLFFLIIYKIFGSKSFKLMRSEIWKEYVESDLLLVGHDNAFLSGGFSAPLYLYPIYLPLFAKLLNKTIVFYGGGLAYFEKRIRNYPRFLIKFSLNRMDLITLRERISEQYLKKLGVRNDLMKVTADLAFLLQPEPEDRVKEIMMNEGIAKTNGPLIGMTITRKRACMAFPDLEDANKSYNKHLEKLAEVIDELILRLNAIIIFVPHCIGFGEHLDDRLVANDIFQLCKNKDKIIVINNEYRPGELKGLIGQFDLFIGERVHSVVNAMSMHVPSLILADSKDIRLDMFKMIGQESAICSIEGADTVELLNRIDEIYSNKDNIKKKMANIDNINNQAMLNAELLKNILKTKRVNNAR